MIISEKIKKILVEEGLDEECVEYLPFVLKDKRGQVVPNQYYIANPLVKVDCYDFEHARHKIIGNNLEPKIMDVIEDNIPEDAKFFRLGEQPRYILIRSDLIERLDKEGFKDIPVKPMGKRVI